MHWRIETGAKKSRLLFVHSLFVEVHSSFAHGSFSLQGRIYPLCTYEGGLHKDEIIVGQLSDKIVRCIFGLTVRIVRLSGKTSDNSRTKFFRFCPTFFRLTVRVKGFFGQFGQKNQTYSFIYNIL